MAQILWENEVKNINSLLGKGSTIEEIGIFYGVSKQRIYQVMTKFGLISNVRERKNFLRGLEPKFYWLNTMLTKKNIVKSDRLLILENIKLSENCPMLGNKLNYLGTGREGWSKRDDSPSLDRIDSSKGYTKDNIQIISWRANRIKNDSTPEELMKIALYMQKLTLK